MAKKKSKAATAPPPEAEAAVTVVDNPDDLRRLMHGGTDDPGSESPESEDPLSQTEPDVEFAGDAVEETTAEASPGDAPAETAPKQSADPVDIPTATDAECLAWLAQKACPLDETQWHKLARLERELIQVCVHRFKNGDDVPLPMHFLQYAAPAAKPPEQLKPRQMDPVTLAVQFGGVSIGDETARLGLKIGRAAVDLATAEKLFCGRRIGGRVRLGDGQGRLDGMGDDDHEIDSVFDSKGLGLKPKHFAVGLTFSLAEIDVSELAKFAKKQGQLVIRNVQKLVEEKRGGASDQPDDPNGPHPDVEAGKNRPHGTPVLEELAKEKARRAAAAEDDDDEAETVPFPAQDGEKLFLCVDQLQQSLRMAGVLNVPNETIEAWSDEARDEVDVWAKSIATAAADQDCDYVDQLPDVLSGFLSPGQADDPVGFVLTLDPVHQPAKLRHYCAECGNLYDAPPDGEPIECPKCGCVDSDLVGYYGDPHVNSDGFYELGYDEFQVPLGDTTHDLIVRLARGADGKFRTGEMSEINYLSVGNINRHVHISDTGYATREAAILAAVEAVAQRWNQIDDGRARQAVELLQVYHDRISNGDDPKVIDEEVTNGDDDFAEGLEDDSDNDGEE